jgi:hypothetical protein
MSGTGMSSLDPRNATGAVRGAGPFVAAPVVQPQPQPATVSRFPTTPRPPTTGDEPQGGGGQQYQPRPQSYPSPSGAAPSSVAAFLAQSLGQDSSALAPPSLRQATQVYASANAAVRAASPVSSGPVEVLAPSSVLSSGKSIDLSV